MKFGDEEHLLGIAQVNSLWGELRGLSALALAHGIDDIFQDNGAKVLQQLVIANLKLLPGREGNDAIDEDGQEWEMKSANVEKVSGYSTHHHLNKVILAKYRTVPWLFSVYRHIELQTIYAMKPEWLEPIFAVWQSHLEGTKVSRGKAVPAVLAINNPKIPLKFVAENGVCIFDREQGLGPFSPSAALRSSYR
jgi:hypothetical protein